MFNSLVYAVGPLNEIQTCFRIWVKFSVDTFKTMSGEGMWSGKGTGLGQGAWASPGCAARYL